MVLPAGMRLGPYEVSTPLGAAGMGEVYRARDTRLDRDVAVKVLPDRLAADPAALSRFEREAKALAALSHPNVLMILDFGLQGRDRVRRDGILEGESLRARLLRAQMSWKDAAELGYELADGLAAAHSRGISPPRSEGREKERAFAFLEEAFEEGHPWIGVIKNDPQFEPLRSDPRFGEMVRRIEEVGARAS